MNPAISQIRDIIRVDVCGKCTTLAEGKCSLHRDRCYSAFNRQAIAICKQVVKPLEAANKWQPIETAPKDNTEVLLHVDTVHGDSVFVGACVNNSFWMCTCGERINPTRWMPLPMKVWW